MQTKGEYRVGTNFNPSKKDAVDQIKQAAAALIDLIETLGETTDPREIMNGAVAERADEVRRLKALAQTAIAGGAMWAVKAATKPERL